MSKEGDSIDWRGLLPVLEGAVRKFPIGQVGAFSALPLSGNQLAARIALEQVAKPVAVALNNDNWFSSRNLMLEQDTSSVGFSSDAVALKLVQKAAKESPADAVRWLEHVLATKRATGLRVHLLWGMTVQEPIRFSDDFLLMPVSDLPDSQFKEMLESRTFQFDIVGVSPYSHAPTPQAALVRKVVIDPLFRDQHVSQSSKPSRHRQHHQDVHDAEFLLSLVASAPVLEAVNWFQYDDPDLQAAYPYAGVSGRMHEIVPFFFEVGEPINPTEAYRTVKAFQALPEKLKKRMRVSIDRYNQALLRRYVGDKAVELVIALESLLVDNKGEHRYKVALRSALICAESEADPLAARAIVRGLYDLRSSQTHTGSVPQKISVGGRGQIRSADLVAEGVEIVKLTLLAIIFARRLPDWWRVEVGLS